MNELLDPTQKEVALWLKQMDRTKVREGWIAVNHRFQGIARAMRPFLYDQFENEKERQAAFDGLTIALLTMAHFEDIERLNALFSINSIGEGKPKTMKDQ